jgi:hypothetical protein
LFYASLWTYARKEDVVLIDPAQMFLNAVNDMPEKFFEVYRYLRERGVSHTVANQAAHESMTSDFKKQVSGQKREE